MVFLLPLFLFSYSFTIIPFLSGIEISPKSIPPLLYEKLEFSYNLVQPFHISNSYGLFRRMTGVGGRPELIIKASMDGKEWKEYLFPYKPQNVTVAPKFNIPHQPRLDWQMWFAALSDINHSYWFFTMLNRLFAGSPSVTTLFEHVPYKKPKFIKVEMYLYNFTRNGNEWWTRKYVKDWIPPIKAEPYLVDQWKKIGFSDPNLTPALKVHLFHYVPIFEIVSAVLLIKLVYHLI